MEDLVYNLSLGAIYLASCFVLLLLGRIMFAVFHPSINTKDELTEKDNLAFSISLVGYYIGIMLTIGAALTGEHVSISSDLISIGIYGGASIIILNISFFIAEHLMLPKFKLRKEIIEDQNTGTGVIEALSYIAIGLIILGANTGGFNALTILVAWLVGLLGLVIVTRFYNIITPYDIHDEIEQNNVAAGVAFSGVILAAGILIGSAISFHHESVLDILTYSGIAILVAALILPVFRFITDKILLPGAKLTDEIVNQEIPNIGCGLIEASAYVGTALLITWCF